jgi:DNA-binding transcriptional ArsR family regulator
MEPSFAVVAEPSRRAILGLLLASERSVGQLGIALRMPQPSVSKHLRVLRDAGFVESRIEAQRRLYRLRPAPLMELDAWLAPFRQAWSGHVAALERHLDTLHGAPAAARSRPAAAGIADKGAKQTAKKATKKPAKTRERKRP